MYKLKWNNEIIETDITTKKEAKFLQKEYALSYGGYIQIIKQYNLKGK